MNLSVHIICVLYFFFMIFKPNPISNFLKLSLQNPENYIISVIENQEVKEFDEQQLVIGKIQQDRTVKIVLRKRISSL